ncbi:MAG: hypothetical protein ACM30H_07325 [Clostridia bacterium]
MALHAQTFPFTAKLIAVAPEHGGVYALWLDGSLIYLGHARGGASTIRSRLVDHYSGMVGVCSRRASHYSWEIAANPAARERELLEEYLRAHERAPRCNERP